VVAGYPLNQAFTAVPARIAGELRAEGTSIYQTGHVDRQVYEIRALEPGDSGGPLLSPSGTADGIPAGLRDAFTGMEWTPPTSAEPSARCSLAQRPRS
jgi:hypothetical protein